MSTATTSCVKTRGICTSPVPRLPTPLLHIQSFHINCLVVGLAVVMIILEEEVLVCAVAGERNGRDSETGEGALETVEAAEGAGIPPGLTGRKVSH